MTTPKTVWINRYRLETDGTFDVWVREKASTQDFYVVHIATGKYLHADGRLHPKRQHFGTQMYAWRAAAKWKNITKSQAYLPS